MFGSAEDAVVGYADAIALGDAQVLEDITGVSMSDADIRAQQELIEPYDLDAEPAASGIELMTWEPAQQVWSVGSNTETQSSILGPEVLLVIVQPIDDAWMVVGVHSERGDVWVPR